MFSFKKEYRLLKKSDYDHVFKQAKKLATSDFTFLYRINEVGHARLGLALSKKVIAKAHDRNRIKRLLRETFRLKKDLPAIDIIVLAKPGIGRASREALLIKLDNTWKKLSVSHDI
jgi:ribonuclease P protein component